MSFIKIKYMNAFKQIMKIKTDDENYFLSFLFLYNFVFNNYLVKHEIYGKYQDIKEFYKNNYGIEINFDIQRILKIVENNNIIYYLKNKEYIQYGYYSSEERFYIDYKGIDYLKTLK